MNIYNLKGSLRKDIFDYRFHIASLLAEKTSLEEEINDLENGKVSPDAKKRLYEKYRLHLNEYNIKNLLPTLKNDLFITNTNLNIFKNILDSTVNAYNALHYYQVLSPNLMGFIKNRLIKEKLSDVDLIKTMEFIKIHNTKCHEGRLNSIASSDLYLVLNMLNSGYEEITIEPIESDKLKKAIQNAINAIESNPLTNIETILTFNNLTIEGQIYVYQNILKYYQDEIYSLISVLKDKDFYFDIPLLQTIKDDYKKLYQKYMFVREKIDTLSSKLTEQEQLETSKISELPSDINELTHLYYSTNSIDPTKCYFVKDIENMREESYSTILDLINTFKSGDNRNTKYLSTNGSFIELKSDQVRIVLKPMGNNNYSVQGAFIKKSDNDRSTYVNIFTRPTAKLDNEYTKQVEEYYIKYLEENQRKGSR